MTLTIYKKRGTSQVFEINTRDSPNEQLLKINSELSLGLSLVEMQAVQAYFRRKNRNPTDVELQTIGQTWSEHCFHKTFKNRIKFQGKVIDGLFKTFIARPAEEIKPEWCFSIFEDNAGIVKFHQNYGVAIKVETHNHPSAVEPFGGAATGTGGVIRDILGVWADPIACTDVLGFGPLNYDYKKLAAGIKHPRYVYMGVVAGIGSYGNNMGIPTVNGAICFDESYVGNVVVYCGCIGLLPLNMFKKKAKIGDALVLVGGKTGRDGIHGVTFASAELTEKSEEISRPAVQIANPFEEEKVKRAIIAVRDSELCSAITDLGGGGLSSAVGETARKFSCGAAIDLDSVPLKYEALTPWEIYISESQERMLLVVPKNNVEKILQIFQSENVEASVIGELTADGNLLLKFKGIEVAEIEISFLFSPPLTTQIAQYQEQTIVEPHFEKPKDLNEILIRLLKSPSIASKESVIRTYDHEVKGNTVLKPLQGQNAGPNDAAVLKPLDSSCEGLVISCGINPRYGEIDPYWMAASVIDESVRNNIAVGGRRIALLDNFAWGNPQKPERLGSLVRACEACYDIAKGLETPFISGKDSLYNESPMGPITPTLLITAVGHIPDIAKAVSMETKKQDHLIYVIGKTFRELGGSEYYDLIGVTGGAVPCVNVSKAKQLFDSLTRAIDKGIVKACHDISEGGLAVAAAEMAFGGDFGIDIDLGKVLYNGETRDDFVLFSESNTRFLVEVAEKSSKEFEDLMIDTAYASIGKVTEKPNFRCQGLDGRSIIDVPLSELLTSWKSTFSGEVRAK